MKKDKIDKVMVLVEKEMAANPDIIFGAVLVPSQVLKNTVGLKVVRSMGAIKMTEAILTFSRDILPNIFNWEPAAFTLLVAKELTVPKEVLEEQEEERIKVRIAAKAQEAKDAKAKAEADARIAAEVKARMDAQVKEEEEEEAKVKAKMDAKKEAEPGK